MRRNYWNETGNLARLWRIGVLVAFVASNAEAAPSYEEHFTAKANKAYWEDINIWAYTPEFAERFAMPKAWIDTGLKGAYAVAFRVEKIDGRLMFPHKGSDVSSPNRSCILDIYLPSDAPLPWAENARPFWRLTPNSHAYLIPQNGEDLRWQWGPVAFAQDVVAFGTGKQYLGDFPVREYDREIFPGITYLSLLGSCMEWPEDDSWIAFMEPGRAQGKKVRALYRIDLPASVMRRLYDLWYEKSRKPATDEWKKILKK